MKYITVKLTEDQIRLLSSLLDDYIKDLNDFDQKITNTEIAFATRLQTTLAKAKNE